MKPGFTGCSLALRAAILALVTHPALAQLAAEHDASGSLTRIFAAGSHPPTLSRGPESVVARIGQHVSLSIVATGSALSYQWQFNSNSIPGAVTSSLLLTNIRLTDFGAYRVVVSNPFGSLASANALVQIDNDNDGLADAWEVTYFGGISNQSGALDRDNDGVPNLAEFQEGTNPTNAASLFPRLAIQAYRCSVEMTPLLEKYTNGQSVLLTAIPDAGQSFIFWSGATNSTSTVVTVTMTTNKSITAQAGLPLGESLDVTNQINSGGNVAWFGQPTDTKDGLDAARSGRLQHNQMSWFHITNNMSGEGTVSFWWKIESHLASDYLRFLINDSRKPGEISGFTNWHQRTYYLTSGVQRVRWEFSKNQNDGSIGDGIELVSRDGNALADGPYPGVAPADAGWVDQLVFEVYADPLRDVDGDGMADLWEYRHFYSLDQNAAGDPDNDAISTLDEFLEGTDPTSNASLKPRLTLRSEGAGTVSAIPNKLKYNYGEIVTNSAVATANHFFVMWTGALFSTNANAPLTMFGNRTNKGVFGFGLDQAVEAPTLNWTRGGAAGWYGQTNVTYDGVDAARSAPVNFGQESWMETTVNGPGLLSYWWKASSLTNLNAIRLNLNGVEQGRRISGDVDWEEQFHGFGPGSHSIRWRFVRNNYEPVKDDAGWVDRVSFLAGDIAPTIRSQPTNVTVIQGSNVVLAGSAIGTPTLLYEWLLNGGVIRQASTNALYIITNIAPAQGLSGYSLRVSNAGGTALGAPFSITVLPVPPANDNFATRFLLSGNDEANGYDFGATMEPNEPNHDGQFPNHSVWWKWSAPAAGKYHLAVRSRGINAKLITAVYTGAAVNNLSKVASAFQSGSFTNGEVRANISLPLDLAAGIDYAVAVGHNFGPAGYFTVRISPLTDTPSPGASFSEAGFSANGQFSFSAACPPNTEYQVDGTRDLITWTTLLTGLVPADGILTFSDPTVNTGLRFYRVLLFSVE